MESWLPILTRVHLLLCEHEVALYHTAGLAFPWRCWVWCTHRWNPERCPAWCSSGGRCLRCCRWTGPGTPGPGSPACGTRFSEKMEEKEKFNPRVEEEEGVSGTRGSFLTLKVTWKRRLAPETPELPRWSEQPWTHQGKRHVVDWEPVVNVTMWTTACGSRSYLSHLLIRLHLMNVCAAREGLSRPGLRPLACCTSKSRPPGQAHVTRGLKITFTNVRKL